MRAPLATTIFAALAFSATAANARTWTDRDGRTVEAEFLRADADNIVIRRADGREFTLPRARLADADLAFVEKNLAAAPTPAVSPTPGPIAPPPWIGALNLALEFPLFVDADLWDDVPSAVAARLRLRPESITPGAESWRNYARPAVPVLGVPAYMFALRAEYGRVAGFNLLFTNRGDHPAFSGPNLGPVGPAAAAAFDAELTRDFQRLRAALAAALPEGETPPTPGKLRAQPGETATFTAGPHEFTLQAWPGQMLSLRVRPTGRAAPPRLSDERARQRLKGRVTRRENGDVVLDQIPMVDQGPKGYCVPATFERLLRYAGISADMYELAALGGTDFGGGTNVPTLVEALGRTVRQAGRRLEEIQIEPTPASLARYLDEGRPVLWSLSSTPQFNLLANAYSEERLAFLATAPKPEALRAWANERRRLGAELYAAPAAAHLCLLIGYNKSTGEVAFSDSWGPGFAERWVPSTAARQVGHGTGWMLDF